MTLEQHIAENAAKIEQEAHEYAKNYGCDIETAREDVGDAYIQGWHEDMEERRYGEGALGGAGQDWG